MKSFYSDFVNIISDILDKKPKQRNFSADSRSEKGEFLNEVSESQNLPAVKSSQLSVLFGTPVGYKTVATIGTHPNFTEMKFGEKRYQYCASMFIDIKGSTNLSLSYNLEEVRLMKDAILSLCIQTVTVFGGHVQRLQGDGLYVQFTDRQIHQNNMMINALNSASLLCQFVSTTLADLFEQRNLKPLHIKVGIDFAEDSKCLWSHYGLPSCNELTATSLHVDLAAKLQAHCASNEIRIGQYVKQFLDLPDGFLTVPKTQDGKDDTYIKRAANYKQYIFNWQSYLLMFDFIHRDNNRLALHPAEFSLQCLVSDDCGKEGQYYQNNGAVPKNLALKFTLMRNGRPYSKTPFDSITWRIVNRGEEAKNANELEEKVDNYKDKTVITVNSAYLGHHYMECVLRRSYESFNRKIKFGVYVM